MGHRYDGTPAFSCPSGECDQQTCDRIWEGVAMNLTYAVERLYDTGWTPSAESGLDKLPDGRLFPSVSAVQREFARAGLELRINHTPAFSCYRATWSNGTVIGACEREAAVYALAQMRGANATRELAAVLFIRPFLLPASHRDGLVNHAAPPFSLARFSARPVI